MPSHSPEDIVRIVNRMESDRSALHTIMDGDLDFYELKPYAGEVGENGEAILDGYKKFTSNDPATTMNLALHLGSTAKRIIRIHKARDQDQQRAINNMKELFCLGVLDAIDERRASLLMPRLQDSLFSQSLFRGRIAQRVLLVKEDIEAPDGGPDSIGTIGAIEEGEPPGNTRTYVDVMDWDPRNTYWEMGKHGLNWACEKSMKTRQQLLDEYGIDPAKNDDIDVADDDTDREYAVYDWLDSTDNTIVVENHAEMKSRTPHGMPRVPVVIGLAELRAQFHTVSDYPKEDDSGQGFYSVNRSVFEQQNFMLSIMAELSKRSISQGLILHSRGGDLTLPEDPRVSGQETSLSTDNEESIENLPPMEMVQEAGTFMGIISGMAQRGSFPASAFGELAFQLSGFAITQLRQGLEAPLTSHINLTDRGTKQILDLLSDAYSTGRFDTMILSGRSQDIKRTFFSQAMQPELIREGGIIEVEHLPQLPHDDASRVALAQMLRDGPVPLADDRFLRERILQFQDVDQMESAIWEQVAQRGSPIAIAFNSMIASAEQGNQEQAQIWEQEFQMALIAKMIQMMQLQSVAGPNAGGNGQSSEGRASQPSPQAQPPEVRGIQSRPGMQAGPVVPPGTPRPGAQELPFGR